MSRTIAIRPLCNRKAKLILAFGNNPNIESLDFRFMESRSVSICYASQIEEPWISRLFVTFSGNNVETSAFLVETTDEEELREKLLKWKVRPIPHYFFCFHNLNLLYRN
ncbi:unnamed protein product [Onchocerca flexuosa]|uniref:Uncharacterized protein n=1 Tax=Onchocerca flexuosa TaxID=387005 RepID=A0A183HVG9_9BILA|nr:unnamed protein product [Onchocerca flexuosa]